MRTHAAFLGLVIAFAPIAARSQDLGLDLTQDPKKEDEPKKEEPKPKKEPAAAPKAAAKPAAEDGDKPAPEMADREVILEDRVKAVQRKLYIKKHRFEVSPSFSFSVNDPFYSKVGGSLALSYYLSDTLSVGVRGAYIQVVASEDVRTAKHAFSARIFHSVPQLAVIGDVVWSPLYGKVTVFNSILHFDAYLLGGVGAVITDASPNPTAGFDLGFGMKFVVKDYLAINAALINTSFVDTPAGTNKGAIQNVMTLNAGFSLFIPFKSTARESE